MREGAERGETHMLPPTSFLLVFYGFSSGCLTFYVTAINFQWHCRFILHTGEWLPRPQPPLPCAVCPCALNSIRNWFKGKQGKANGGTGSC